MLRICREVDVVARIGGEEFALLLPGVDHDAALAVAERLRAEVAQAPAAEQQAIPYTVSIGVAAMDDSVAGIDALIKQADQALYAAKRRGRNQVVGWRDTEKP
jgi:diguanylate cyclase (GGDEF)-like protein